MNQLKKFILREGFFPFLIKCSDVLLRPFGISFFSYIKFKKANFFKNRISFNKKKIFTHIYKKKYWKKQYSLSGKGSELNNNQNYIKNLKNLLLKLKINLFFDIPCGDMSWMPYVIKDLNIQYIGGDIVKELIDRNKKQYPKLNFCKFDLKKDFFPKVQLVHIRDCLFHFSFKDIKKTINNLKKSKINYVLITSHKSLILKNYDITTGDFRYLDLEKKPFNFPKPILRLRDYSFGDFPRYVNLWKLKHLPRNI